MENFFKDKYPPGMPSEVDVKQYSSIVDMLEKSCKKFANNPAFSAIGVTITYAELDKLSRDFASFLQNETNLKPGDRIAIQMPNLVQYPVVVFGAMRAGLVVVNTNPLYTKREMEHQFNDSGAKALVVLANMAHLAEEVLPNTGIETVIVTEIADMHKPVKRAIMNAAVKYIKKMVPAYNLPKAIPFTKAMQLGAKRNFTPVKVGLEDLAVLQYTGGTTGVAKGAMLTQQNLVANLLQVKPVLTATLEEGKEVCIAPLPLYHIYSFTVNCGVMVESGCHSVLIPNPRDIDGFIKELKKWKFSAFLGLNTLFVALCNRKDFQELDFSHMKMTVSGGMALTTEAARMWKKVTGCDISEGYGMTETSPVVSVNQLGAIQVGTIGLPVPSTQVKVIDDEGNDLPIGEVGELCVKGPQVMKGYWQRPDETAKTMTPDGWLKTGDIALIQEDGYIKIVDRKKDMILVSGFNVYPNEVEDVVASHPDVLECAAIGVPDDKSGEVVKIFVIRRNPNLKESELREFCKQRLTGYKMPKYIEFREELPKTNVGKILRRELRDEELKKQKTAAA